MFKKISNKKNAFVIVEWIVYLIIILTIIGLIWLV